MADKALPVVGAAGSFPHAFQNPADEHLLSLAKEIFHASPQLGPGGVGVTADLALGMAEQANTEMTRADSSVQDLLNATRHIIEMPGLVGQTALRDFVRLRLMELLNKLA